MRVSDNGRPAPAARTRHARQQFVFFSRESPVNTDLHKLSKLDNYSNRTVTYRRDWDMVTQDPYGRVRTGPSDRTAPRVQLAATNKTVAWLVSHCRRQVLAARRPRPVLRELPLPRLRHRETVPAVGSRRGAHRCTRITHAPKSIPVSFNGGRRSAPVPRFPRSQIPSTVRCTLRLT